MKQFNAPPGKRMISYQLDLVRQVLIMDMRRWRVRQLRGGLSSLQMQRLERWLARRLQRLGWTYIGPMEASVSTDTIVPGSLRPDGRDVNCWLMNKAALQLRGKVAWGPVPDEHKALLYRSTAQVVRMIVDGDRPDA